MKAKQFQIRWNEPLGKPECPYMYRWSFIFFGYSIRVHHWIRSDDKRFYHDHPWNFVTVILKGSYIDVSGATDNDPLAEDCSGTKIRQVMLPLTFHFRKAEHRHYVEVPKCGCWTLLLTGRPKRNWGFWIKPNQFFRPLRYFSKYSHPPCDDQ